LTSWSATALASRRTWRIDQRSKPVSAARTRSWSSRRAGSLTR
jgi:hypothetical protein